MALILQASDFESGEVKVGYNDLTQTDFETYFSDAKQIKWIYEVMGKTEGDLFIADITSYEPQTAKWITIFNELNFEVGNCTYYTGGIKKILEYLAYHDYVNDQSIFNTPAGNKSVKAEASDREGLIKKSCILFNRAVDYTHVLRYYMQENSSDYPNLEQQTLPYSSVI